MGIYDELLDKVIDYIDREPVEDTDEIVSAYSLWAMLSSEIKNLQYVLYDNEILKNRINDFYKDMFFSGKEEYKKSIENFNFKLPVFMSCKFKKITSSIEENKLIISLWPDGKKNKDKHIDICKDVDDDNYYGDNINDYLIRYFKLEFDRMFQILEFFAHILKNDTKRSQFITNSIMDVIINYPIDGKISIDVKLNRNIDPTDSQYKNYFEKPYTIHDIIEKQKKTILLNTPIEVKQLNHLCSSVVKKYRKIKNEENKVLKK